MKKCCGCKLTYPILIVTILIHAVLGELPKFSELPVDGTIAGYRGSLTLRCSASGVPPPKIVNWLLNDKPVNFNTGNHFLRPSGELYISSAQKSDSGFYQCVAQNIDGGIVSAKRRVDIAYFDRLSNPTVARISVKERSSHIILPPKISCEPKPNYIWSKDGKIITESNNVKNDIRISADGGLYISNIGLSAQGTYKLKIENTFMATKNMQYASQDALEIVLTVISNFNDVRDVSVIYSSPKQEVGEGKTPSVTLECFITGIDAETTEVSWMKVDDNNIATPVKKDNLKYTIQDNTRRLLIDKPTYVEDNGKFRCVPYYRLNPFQNNARDIELIVASPVKFLTKEEKLDVYTDNSTMLNCTSYGLPNHTTRWYRNGIPLLTSGSSHTIYQNNSIFLSQLNWEDNGVFQCGAENAAGLNFLQIQLNVRNITAVIEGEFKDQYLYVDTTSTIPCVAVGAPKPTVTWKRNTFQLLQGAKYDILQNGTLVIKDVKATDSGTYTCTASNFIQTVERSAEVYIVTPTRISKSAPREFPVQKGTSPRLFCEVEHDPRVNYTREWRFNNLPIRSDYYVLQPDGSLMVNYVQNPRDTDIDFSCHIFADDGNFSYSTTLVLKNRPLQPSSPRVIDVQPFSLTVNWDAPSDGGSALLGFILYMKNITTDYVVLAKLNASETTYTIEMLHAGTLYRFQVAAENKFGPGERSAESQWIETKTLAPSAAPRDFRSFDAGADFVKLAWKEPAIENVNGRLLGYNIAYRVAGFEGEGSFTIIDLQNLNTEYEMTGLPLFTKYEVKVAAYNKAGRGPWSNLNYVATLQGIPSAGPTDVTVSVKNSTTVLVSFTSPPQQLWNGQLTYIVARYWPPELPQNQLTYRTKYDTSSIYKQSFYLPTLEADREYVLAVAVGTTGGPSTGSLTVQFRTNQGRPEQVQDLQVSNTYADAFTVSWKKPIKTGGTITGYVIKYRVFTSQTWNELKENGKALGAVVPNLQSKTKYEVEVAAMTSAGLGPFTRRSAITTEKPELPKAPSNLKAYAVWGSSIALGWTPGDSGRAVILYYKIEYNNDTDYRLYPERAKWYMIRNLTKILENPANITGLKPSSIYRFRMTAVNRVGPSLISNISDDITTGEGIPSGAPTDIIITAPIQKGLLIKWNPPTRESWNSGSVKYQFLIKPKGQDLKIKVPYMSHPDAQATSYTARGLQMYTEYNVTIRLYNDKGFGPWSKPAFLRTSEDYPSGAPTIQSSIVDSSSTVRLTWGPVPEDQRNGVILGYKVFYQISGVENTELFKDYPGNTTFSGVIDGLNGYTDYEFRLLAYTKVGGKLKSSPVTKKTKEGVPDKPTNVKFTRVTYDFVEVEWDPPTRPNGQIMTYRVHYKRNITGAQWIEAPISQFSSRSAKALGLVFNSYYLFKIEGRTAPGWGLPALEYVLVTTDRELPESPVILGIPFSSVRQTSVVVQWRPRFDGNSPIRSYNLQYNKDYSGWQTYKYGMPPVENIPSEINRIEVDKLDYASQYQFRIRSNNDIGNSPWSDNSKTVTTHQKDPKGAPGNVRVVEKTPTTMLIAWEPPKEFDLSSAIRGYRVSWELSAGIGGAKEKSVSENTFQLRIEKLKVFSAYEVRVGVFNEFGAGIWSQKYKWRTGEDSPLEAPTNVNVVLQGRNTVRVTWAAPDADNVRGWALGYKIESRRLGSGSKRKRRSTSENINPITRQRRSLLAVCKHVPPVTTHLAGPHAQEVTLKNLRKFTRYEITVRVYNSYGDGPKSRPASFSTPADVPGPPYILSDRVYTDSIAIDFAEPCDPNGQILGYRVRYKEFTQQFSPNKDYSSNTRRVEIKDLKRQTNYIFELSAKTSLGYGQVATIDFRTKVLPVLPGKPGAPEVYENKPGILVLKWDERDNGNAPVTKFTLEYKKDGGAAEIFKEVMYSEVRYDGPNAIYMPGSLKPDQKYQFRVNSQTKMGVSPWSDWSKPIVPVTALERSKPVHEEIWFIFLLVIIFLIILIIAVVCCWRHGCKEKMKYKTKNSGYNMSSFEMAMVQRRGGSEAGSEKRLLPASRNGSLAPSVASSTKKSIAKSCSSLGNSDERELLTQQNTPMARREMPEDSIANHYSNDPYHKNWRDSLDPKTKKEILAEYAKRRPSDDSVDSLEEKRAEPIYDRARPRPGRKDINELRNMARSQPELAIPGGRSPYQQQNQRPQGAPRRPGKLPVDRNLARSVPDLNRPNGQIESPVTRAPSFLRATAGDSEDNESLHEVFQREKSKREMAMDLDDRVDDFYPNTAPPPYDYNGAPPAYSPSDISEGSEFDYGKKNRSYLPPRPPSQPRLSDYSDNSDFGRRDPSRNHPPLGHPVNSGYNRPQPGRGYFSPEEEYPGYQPSPPRNPQRYPPDPHGRQRGPDPGGYAQGYPPSSSTEPPRSTHSSDHQFAPAGGFLPPQNAYIDEDGDEIDGYEPDMTLV